MRKLFLDHMDGHRSFTSLEQAFMDNFGLLN